MGEVSLTPGVEVTKGGGVVRDGSASPVCIFCPRGCGAGHGLGGPGWKQESPRGERRLATLWSVNTLLRVDHSVVW